MLLGGLSDDSRWRRWASEQPVDVVGEDAVKAVIAEM